MEVNNGCLVDGAYVAIFGRMGECFADDVETVEDEDLPATDEAFNVLASDKVAPCSTNAGRVAAQRLKVIPATLEVVPNFSDRFPAYGNAGFDPPTGTLTRQCGMYGAAYLRHLQCKREVLRRH